jgi:predicted metalloprotease with PDZ domain
VPEDGVERAASEVAGRDMSEFFARYVHGTEDPPLDRWLADFGVDFHLRTALNATDRGGKPASATLPRSALDAKVGADMKLLAVYAGGAAERAGLAAGDHLVALDGLKATVETLRTLLERHAPGDTLRVHAFRRDELAEHKVLLADPPPDTCFLALQENPGEDAMTRRTQWLTR